ncbi:MAG: 3-deoxy-7-phosphoheptulonate synthase [Pseudomonadota bacterium]
MNNPTDDLRIREQQELTSPQALVDAHPLSATAADTVTASRQAARAILDGDDDRLVVVVGPCSIHDPAAAREYAGKLQAVMEQFAPDLHLVMRVYFEKPRTTVGWKGLINDPHLDESFDINSGLVVARELLIDINEMGVSCGVEFLDLISPQFIADLVSWGAIGARTTESQSHRELASGLSCPVGFKNGTAGSVQIAVDALRSAAYPHRFIGVTKGGASAILTTTGNSDCHVILRGGKTTNYDAASVDDACALLAGAKQAERVMIDFSHANSRKKHARQLYVGQDVAAQVAAGDRRIIGVMIESHLIAGNQSYSADREPTYGQSITDACIGWDDTVPLLEKLANAVRARRASGA